jgi:hypothetical protein
VTGPVCGSGTGDATWSDDTVANDTAYRYSVVSVNDLGASAASSPTAAATPTAGRPLAVPSAPLTPVVTDTGHHLAALRWTPVAGAASYTIWRSTMHPDGLGGFYAIGTRRVASTTATVFADRSVSDGRVYDYHLTAENAIGSGPPSPAARAAPVPPAPTDAPGGLAGSWKDFRGGAGIVLAWKAVPGATGYVIYRSTADEPLFSWPADFRTALLETTFFDQGDTDKRAKVKGLDPATAYTFRVSAVNAGGVSPPTTVRIPARKTR